MYRVSKQILAVGVPFAVVAASGVAIAYWTNNGTGTGTATTANPVTLTVAQKTAPTGMGPGVAAGPIEVTVSNPGTSSITVNQVVASIASVTDGVGACSATDYTLTGGTMITGAATLAAGASTTFSGATLGFANSDTVNQDGCKGANVNLSYTAS